MPEAPTCGDVVADALREVGVARVYGHPLTGLPHVEVAHADVALLLADVDGRLGDGWGAALLDGQLLHLSSQPGGRAHPATVGSPAELVAMLVEHELDTTPRTVALALDFDLSAPFDGSLDVPARPDGGVLVTLSPGLAGLRIVALVGPGVARGHADQVAELAARGGIGVFNTWGAKGVLRWDNPAHFGTIGLQERDAELAGLASADLVLTSGLDPDECPSIVPPGVLVQDLPPYQLVAALADWPRAHRQVPERPPLYGAVSGLVTPWYERSTGPVTPARAALHLAGAAPEGAVVVADAGVAGFWIARTFPTGLVGSVVVPALDQPGVAAAGALVAGLAGRPCVGVIDGPPDESTLMVMEAAASLGVPIALQSWVDGTTTPDEHVEICARGFAGGEPTLDVVGVDPTCFAPIEELLGPVTAWTDDPVGGVTHGHS